MVILKSHSQVETQMVIIIIISNAILHRFLHKALTTHATDFFLFRLKQLSTVTVIVYWFDTFRLEPLLTEIHLNKSQLVSGFEDDMTLNDNGKDIYYGVRDLVWGIYTFLVEIHHC